MFMVGIMLNMDEYDEQKHQGGILKRSIIFVAINGGVKWFNQQRYARYKTTNFIGIYGDFLKLSTPNCNRSYWYCLFLRMETKGEKEYPNFQRQNMALSNWMVRMCTR